MDELDDTTPAQPRVTDAPDTIYLNYGDIERDATHRECCASGEVTWCEDAVFESDVKYVRADRFEALVAALKKANDQAEHFEREWYLRGDQIEALQAELAKIRDIQACRSAATRPESVLVEMTRREGGKVFGSSKVLDLKAVDRAILPLGTLSFALLDQYLKLAKAMRDPEQQPQETEPWTHGLTGPAVPPDDKPDVSIVSKLAWEGLPDYRRPAQPQQATLVAERDALRQDAARLDYLESLLKRTEHQNSRRPNEPVNSDMHFTDRRCSLYLRNMFGHCVTTGSGESVRAAIDAAMKEQTNG